MQTTPTIADYFTLKNGDVENTDSNDGQFNVNGALDKSIDPINNQTLELAISSSKNLTCQVSGSTDSSVITCDRIKKHCQKQIYTRNMELLQLITIIVKWLWLWNLEMLPLLKVNMTDPQVLSLITQKVLVVFLDVLLLELSLPASLS